MKGLLELDEEATAAVKSNLGITGTMTRQQIGNAAEISAAWGLTGRGHEVLGSIQRTGGQGIDLVTRYKGHYYIWEVKGNSADLSSIQRRPGEFTMTRIFDAAIGAPDQFTPESQKLASELWNAPVDRLHYGVARVEFSE
jgi:hypothetical protein